MAIESIFPHLSMLLHPSVLPLVLVDLVLLQEGMS